MTTLTAPARYPDIASGGAPRALAGPAGAAERPGPIRLEFAYEMHQAGRFADAARGYHAVLERDPDHAPALHLFGVMHHQCGHCARAAELIGRAVTLRPDVPAYHANLAEAQRALGRHDQAAESCRTALRLP